MNSVKTSVHRSFSFRKSGKNVISLVYANFGKVRIPFCPLRDIVKSLINGDNNYFGTEKYGAVTFAVHPGLDYNNMKSAADGYGSRPFGFGDGQSFCTQFVHDIINAGGGGLPKISDEIMKNKGALMKAIILGGGNLRKVADMDIAPTPGNFVKKIRSQFPGSNTGNNSLNTN